MNKNSAPDKPPATSAPTSNTAASRIEELTLPAPAKLNLFLHINGRRANGYHDLQTLFQILDHGDELHFENTPSKSIQIEPNIEGVPLEDNLIYKAAKLLQTHCKTSQGVSITLNKKLPMGGGLGGGSSNAATTLLALNTLWQLNLSNDKLAELGLQLGADVPVFVRGHSAFAEGVGEQLLSVDLPQKWYVVLAPKCHVSTAELFSNERLTRDTPKIKIAPASEGQLLELATSKGRNDCQAIATSLFPEIKDALDWLNQFGNGRMTGTGACCFCSVDNEAKAQQILNEAQSKFEGFIAKGVNLSPAIERLNEASSLQ